MMRKLTIMIPVLATLVLAGCAGPEKKLGRGITNVTEFVRMGELRRSIEQSAYWDGQNSAFTTGFIRGFNRSIVRTFVGAYEIVTFPIPSYEPAFTPKHKVFPDLSVKNTRYPWGGLRLSASPVYPATYTPNILSTQLFATDTSLGFSGGDIAPMIIGSRFRIFDN